MSETRRLLRVFPRRTSYTPTDDMAFVGWPPLGRPEADEVHVSVTFTWDRECAEQLAEAWRQYYPVVKLGGPAYGTELGAFVPGRYVREGVTFTTRGCGCRCPWCLVPERSHGLTLIDDFAQGWIVQDNNLLQAPREHILRVFAMLNAQKRAITFAGGLDTTLIDDWVTAELWDIDVKELFLAADTTARLKPLRAAVKRLEWLRRDQLRCYVLLAFNGETIPQATERLEAVWEAGCLPFAQLYQPADRWIDYPQDWRDLARAWSRPAITKAMHS